jgi:putative ABC transport system permease protein
MLIWAGLWRKRARTVLTMLSIIVAFLLFGLLQGINQGIKSGLGDSTNNRLWTTSHMSDVSGMPMSLLPRIKAVKGVREVAHISFFGGYYQDAKNALPAYATNIDAIASVYPELNISAPNIEAMKITRAGALIGRPLAKKYNWKVGDKVPVGTTIWTDKNGSNSWSFDIVGIFDPSPRYARSSLGSAFWLNYEYWDEGRAFGNHMVHQYISAVDDPTHAVAIASAIDKLNENSPQETRTQTENAALQNQLKQLVDINFIANAIVGAVMFTLLFLTGNTMMQSVRERIPELAVLKTLGYPSATVCVLVLLESLLLCLLAAVIGLVLSATTLRIIGTALGGSGAIRPAVVVDGFAIAILLSMISGLAPALRAQRLNIVDALAGR